MKLKIEKAPFGAATPSGAKQYMSMCIVAQIGVNENGILRKRRETGFRGSGV